MCHCHSRRHIRALDSMDMERMVKCKCNLISINSIHTSSIRTSNISNMDISSRCRCKCSR